MSKNDRPKIKIDREKETRSKEISKFISEGGLGARTKYYNIEKVASEDEEKDEIDNK